MLLVREHYTHSAAVGTQLAFGAFVDLRLLGVLTLGVGPYNTYRLVDGASPSGCLTLSRLWLDDELPANSESRVLGVMLRALKRSTNLKFLISYSDPARLTVPGLPYPKADQT